MNQLVQLKNKNGNVYPITKPHKILWSGSALMTSGISLSEKISEQQNGIVLCWSIYGSEAEDWGFNYIFIPKEQVEKHEGSGICCFLTDNYFNLVAIKYIYVGNTAINGNSNNDKSGTGNSGIKYQNSSFALRYVIGV